jgi:hypothetical protein
MNGVTKFYITRPAETRYHPQRSPGRLNEYPLSNIGHAELAFNTSALGCIL